MDEQSSVEKLLWIMSELRHPDHGCPWDLEQDFASIVPSTLEEAYELADTIERGDYAHLAEELGDLLFQVIFYSQLGVERDLFSFDSVASGLAEKLIRRHPHVFDRESMRGPADIESVGESWERIKQQEREQKSRAGILADVPVTLPAISRAAKLQKRASRVGFDWSDPRAVIQHLRSELDELEQALDDGDTGDQAEEFGDLLFCAINLSRHIDVDAEQSLRDANRKFERRFHFIEQALEKDSKSFAGTSLERLDALWEQAKLAEKN